MMQQRFLKRSGFIDDWMDYSHHAIDEASALYRFLAAATQCSRTPMQRLIAIRVGRQGLPLRPTGGSH